MTNHYIATRGAAPVLNVEGAVPAGVASDGRYVPDSQLEHSPAEIAGLGNLGYQQLAEL